MAVAVSRPRRSRQLEVRFQTEQTGQRFAFSENVPTAFEFGGSCELDKNQRRICIEMFDVTLRYTDNIRREAERKCNSDGCNHRGVGQPS